MNKYLIPLAIIFLTAAAYCQAPPDDLQIIDDDSLFNETPPWPATDSLAMPAFEGKGDGIFDATVVVQLFVSRDSTVKKCEIVTATPRGLGYEDAVKQAVRGWRFIPARMNDKPTGVWLKMEFKFASSERNLSPDQFVKCQRNAIVGKQPDPTAIYQPPVIVRCPH